MTILKTNMNKQNVITFNLFNFRKMARTLNSKCDFIEGFFACDIPKDAIQLVLKIKTKWGKHTLMGDHERRTEKYRLWDKNTEKGKVVPNKRVDSFSLRKVHDSGSTSDSGTWITAPSEFEYRPKIFNDP